MESRRSRSERGSGPQSPKSTDALFAEISAARLAFEEASTPLERLNIRARLDSLRAEVAGHPRTGLAGLTDAQLQRRTTSSRRNWTWSSTAG